MTVGERVRQARLARKMTLSALGEASGLSKGFISQVESGRSNPSLDSLERIASSLGLPLAGLLHDSSRPRPAPRSAPQAPRIFRASRNQSSVSAISPVSETATGLFSLVALEPG